MNSEFDVSKSLAKLKNPIVKQPQPKLDVMMLQIEQDRKERQQRASDSENLDHIAKYVESLKSDLDNERKERKKADRKNFIWSLIGIISGVIATIGTVISIVIPFIK